MIFYITLVLLIPLCGYQYTLEGDLINYDSKFENIYSKFIVK